VTVSGVTGVVMEIGIFSSTINTSDNVSTIIGNNKILGDNIQNFSSTEYRRVDLKCQLAVATNPEEAMQLLQEKVAAIPKVLTEPSLQVNILEFNLAGPVLAVRPYCKNADYWEVYFEVNRIIAKTISDAGFQAPSAPSNTSIK
jgi:small conductance mechanosensitive channel